jgi:hypothetical protein
MASAEALRVLRELQSKPENKVRDDLYESNTEARLLCDNTRSNVDCRAHGALKGTSSNLLHCTTNHQSAEH